MKIKQNSFSRYLNYSKRPSSFIKFKNSSIIPSSLKSNRKLYNHYLSPNKENEILLIKQKFLNNKKNYNFQSSYFSFLAPILNFKKQSEITNKSKKNHLILTSIDNSSLVKGKDKIFPYEYNKSKKKVVNKNNLLKKSTINNLNKNNISLANFLSINKKKKTKKKCRKHITPDSNSNNNKHNKINSKLNTEKRNNIKRTKNYFTTSLRTRKNSRGWSDKGKEKEREKLMKKLNILDFKKLAKPHSKIINGECFTFKGSSHHYGLGLTYDSNRKTKSNNFNININNNNNKKKYGINHFMDYLRGANIVKFNKKTNKNISISSLGNISYKKVANNNSNNNSSIVNRIKSPINVNHSCTATINNISNNSKLNKNSMIYSIKNISSIHNKKKKLNSKEHKKTKSINIGPMSYPCFNCFFNIINDNGNNGNNNNYNNSNNNIKSKLNNITIDMNYGRAKKKIIFFCDKNNFNHKPKSEISNTMIENNMNNLNNKKGNLYSNNNLNCKKFNNPNHNNVVSNYYININNQIDNHNINNENLYKKNRKENSTLIQQKINKIISQSQQELATVPKTKKKNYTTKNSPSKILSQRISTDNNTKNNNIKKNKDKNNKNNDSKLNNKKNNKTTKNSKSKKSNSKKDEKEKMEIKSTKNTNNKKIKNNNIKIEENLNKEKEKEKGNKANNLEKSDHKNNSNISISSKNSVNKDYNYYMIISNKLSNYIKDYYKKFQSYPPTQINFYKYGRLIGQGAFGKVNIGLNVLSGRVVAIKSFNKNKLTINSENMKKIMYETNLMQKLNHPNITKILEMFEDDKFILIIMEYINGGNLFSFVKKRRKLSEKISKFLFRQIILGIKHIHSKNIVHRDIKLENILIDLNNRIKICDFGIGVILNSEDELLYDQCGTPMYMAPEILLSSNKKGYKGFPVDVWSAGIALYIMLSGTLPFNIKKNKSGNLKKNIENSDNSENSDENDDDISLSNNNNYNLQYSIVHKKPKRIEKISNEARDLLQGLLNKDPNKRLTIDEILNHPWLKSEENDNEYNNNNKYKLFTKAEMIMLSKNYIDYRIKGNDDLKEIFTISNLNDTKEDDTNLNKNIKTKSSILAPYNTLIENESCRYNDEGEIEFDNGELFNDFNNSKIILENDIINMEKKVKQFYINYELNNNGELDNGMIIQSKSKSNTFGNLSLEESKSNNSEEKNINNNNYDDYQKKEEMKKAKILDVVENLGYDKKYVLDCVENNKLCHASAVFYLLMNYENI